MEVVQAILAIGGLIILVLGIVHVLVDLVWFLFPIFNGLNILMWRLMHPIRWLYRNNKKSYPRIIYFLMLPFYFIWCLLFYVYSSPMRYLISFYYNIILFLSVSSRDAISDVISPVFSKVRYRSGFWYFLAWTIGLPYRLIRLIAKEGIILIQSALMFVIDCVFPSLTLYHGTDFSSASMPILKKSKWYVGNGDYAGSGIYFALSRKVAEHYASTGDPSIMVCRVNLFPIRPISTLKLGVRCLAGSGGKGSTISGNAGIGTTTLEHWRKDRGGWYEYCMVQANKAGQYVNTWRIRPICVLKKSSGRWYPNRVVGGSSFWPNSAGSLIMAIASVILLVVQYTIFDSL